MKLKGLMVLLYTLLGVYFLNYLLKFFTLPESLLKIDSWVVFIGGIFLLIAGYNLLRKKKVKTYF